MFLIHQTNAMYTRNSYVKNMTIYLTEYESVERFWSRFWLLVKILHIHGILLEEDKIIIHGFKNTTIIVLLTECDKPRKN